MQQLGDVNEEENYVETSLISSVRLWCTLLVQQHEVETSLCTHMCHVDKH